MKTQQYLAAAIAIPLACFLFAEQALSSPPHAGVEVDIVSDQRGELRKYKAESNKKTKTRNYVIARENEEYRIRLHNRTGERIGVVVAVDGRNIISGRQSHLRPRENMYILNPYQTAEYSGWRSDSNHVNRFFFTHMNNSYAAAWGYSSHVGVIAVAAFKERYQKKPQYNGNNQNRRHNRMSDRPGTGYGKRKWSPSRMVSFLPRKKPMLEEFIKYEYRSTLCQRRVIRCRPTPPAVRHGAVFGHFQGSIFAPPPSQIWHHSHHAGGERGRRHADGRAIHRVPDGPWQHARGKFQDMAPYRD